MSDYNFEKLEIANFKVEEIRQMQIDILKEYGAIIEDDATLAECAQAIGTVVLRAQSFYRCLTVDRTNKKWTGYRGTFASDGSWVFDYEEISDLKYKYIAPEEGAMYNADAQLRLLSVNCDPRFLDIFWKEDWAKDPEDKKLVTIKDPTTGATSEVWVEQPTSATRVRQWRGPVMPADHFGINNDIPRTYEELGREITVPGQDMPCAVSLKSNLPDAAYLYAAGRYKSGENGNMLFERDVWKSKDFSFFCWQKGSFRSDDEILSFVAPNGTEANLVLPEYADRPAEWPPEKEGFCYRFTLFSDSYNGWKPGYSDNETYYGSTSGRRGHLYHAFQWWPDGPMYNENYWHLWGCTYNHMTRELKGYFDGKELDTYHVESDFDKSVMDIAGCTVLVGWAGGEKDHRVGFTMLSQSCLTPEQVEYLANSTQIVAKRKPLIVAEDQNFSGVAGEMFEGYINVADNFTNTGHILDSGTLKFVTEGLPEWIEYFPDSGISEESLYFYGTPPSPGSYAFTLTISGVPPENYPAPDPVIVTYTIDIQ